MDTQELSSANKERIYDLVRRVRKDRCIDHSGRLHSAVGPALVEVDENDQRTTIEYYWQGKLSLRGGPARICRYSDGSMEQSYWIDGRLHRTNGPALILINPEGHKTTLWYYEGVMAPAPGNLGNLVDLYLWIDQVVAALGGFPFFKYLTSLAKRTGQDRTGEAANYIESIDPEVPKVPGPTGMETRRVSWLPPHRALDRIFG